MLNLPPSFPVLAPQRARDHQRLDYGDGSDHASRGGTLQSIKRHPRYIRNSA